MSPMLKIRSAIKKVFRTYRRYIISFSIVFLAPLIVLGYAIYLPVINIMEKQAISNQERQLTQLMGMVDTRFTELESINIQISNNIYLTNYSLHSDDSYGKYLAAKEIKKILSSNSFILDIAIYLIATDYVYCSGGHYSLESYYTQKQKQLPLDWAEFSNALRETASTISNKKIFYSQNISKPQQNHIAIYPGNVYAAGTAVLFLLNQNTINNLLLSNISDKAAICMIIDRNNNIIAGTNHVNFNDISTIFIADYDKQQKNNSILIFNTDYVVSYVESRLNGWSYYVLTPKEVLFTQAYSLRKVTMTVMFSLTAGIIGIITFLSFFSHNPVKKIRKFLEETPQSSAAAVVLDDFDAIGEHLNSIIDNYRDIAAETDINKNLLKKHLIYSLLNESSDVEMEERMESIMHHVGLRLQNEWFRVCIIFIPKEFNYQANEILMMIELEGNSQFFVNAVDDIPMEKGQYFFILLNYTQHNSSLDYINNILNNIQRCIAGLNIKAYIGCGGEQHGLSVLGDSFLEACYTLENNIAGNTEYGFIHSRFDIKSTNDAQELCKRIQTGWNKEINAVVDKIESNADAMETQNAVCYLLGIFYQLYSDSNIHKMNLIISNIRLTGILSSDPAEYKSKILQLIRRISMESSVYYNDNKKNEEEPGKVILSYVEQNLYSSQFNLKELASQMRVSHSYLTRYFKQQTGQSITEHILKKRINRAKQLLAHSDMSVKETGYACGYNDISNFYRKFKSIEGVTPSEFRKTIIDKGEDLK